MAQILQDMFLGGSMAFKTKNSGAGWLYSNIDCPEPAPIFISVTEPIL